MMTFKAIVKTSVAVMAITLGSAVAAQTTNLRIQTHISPESPAGRLAGQFVQDVEMMSDGDIKIEMFYSASAVAPSDTFDAVRNQVLSCDMTNGGYQTGKNPAFQFVNDIMGGYDTPLQQLSWLYYGGGKEAADKLYNKYGMKFVGWWVGGQESLISTKPLRGVSDLKDFKFRSPPGMESEIFAALGAKPVVMDFTEIFTALETGIIDGADASSLANNVGLGLYDIAEHTTYPGFHSMAADHLACNLNVWNKMPKPHQEIIETAMQKLSLHTAMSIMVKNSMAAADLTAKGVHLYDWSIQDRAEFREAAKSTWSEWAKRSPEAAVLVESHTKFLKKIGL
jgi:TRAP-type mannitol/chloroaromatic compound transport system substrate-binding protein